MDLRQSFRSALANAVAAMRAFADERKAASAIEFAILSPLFFAALFVLVQACLVSFEQHLLDNATAIAGRSLALGTVQTNNVQSAAEFKRRYVCPNLMGLLNCNDVIADIRITPDSSPDFNPTVWNTTPIKGQGQASYCVGSAGDYAFMRIAYPLSVIGASVMPDSMLTLYNGRRVAMLQSFGALRIEPVGVKRVGAC